MYIYIYLPHRDMNMVLILDIVIEFVSLLTGCKQQRASTSWGHDAFLTPALGRTQPTVQAVDSYEPRSSKTVPPRCPHACTACTHTSLLPLGQGKALPSFDIHHRASLPILPTHLHTPVTTTDVGTKACSAGWAIGNLPSYQWTYQHAICPLQQKAGFLF